MPLMAFVFLYINCPCPGHNLRHACWRLQSEHFGERRWYCFRQVHEQTPRYKTLLLPDLTPSDGSVASKVAERGCPSGAQGSEPEHWCPAHSSLLCMRLTDLYDQASALAGDRRSCSPYWETLSILNWLHGMCLNPDVHDFVTWIIWIILSLRKQWLERNA